MKILSFQEIKSIDEDLASMFQRPEEAGNWICIIENEIKKWIGEHNKQYWEVVRYVSWKRGIIGKLSRNGEKIKEPTRKVFATLLLKFCPKAFNDGETVSALKSSMEHYQYVKTLWNPTKEPDGHVAFRDIKEVESLFDKTPLPSPQEEKEVTPQDVVEQFLRREIDIKPNGFPRSIICIRPQYAGVNPAISIETYKSELLLSKKQPTNIEVYEFINGVLNLDKLNSIIGQYYKKPMKLFIVSTFGLLPDVRAKAIEDRIGYVRLNPDLKGMDSTNYILPRSIEDYSKYQKDLEVLTGTRPMTTPFLVMDGRKLTSSLADALSENGVVVKQHRLMHIPYLSDTEIENVANKLTKNDEETKIQLVKCFSLLDKDLSFDPFSCAKSLGLEYVSKVMEEDYQLGCYDVGANRIVLNQTGLSNYNRYRFTMAHELGHYILHSHLFKEQGIVSVGESEYTLVISKNYSHRLEYQANKFASCLLMPKEIVSVLYSFFFEIFVHQRYGDRFHPLYYNPQQPETWQSYNGIVGNMARLLDVSRQAMEIRLKSLGLLIMPSRQQFYNFPFRIRN